VLLLQITSQDDEFKPYEVAETMKYLIADDDLTKADMVSYNHTYGLV
jgi:hypothetical protein